MEIFVWLRAFIFIPVGFAGAFTVLALEGPRRTWFEVCFPLAILGPIYLALFLVRRWMGRQPRERTYLGLTRGSWSVLVIVAYAIGAGAALLL